MIHEEYIVLDTETDTQGRDVPDPEQDVLRYVGCKYKDKRVCFHYTQKEQIQKAISWGKYIVGHNLKLYDKRVLERHGFKFNYKQVLIDTYEISENRLKSMMYLDLNVGDKSLSALCDRFNLPNKKGEFDYSLLSKDSLEGEEYNLLVEYLFGDLDATDDLFKYFYEFFYGFRKYMSKDNQDRMCWLINRPGSTSYKIVCNIAGLEEKYSDVEEDENEETYEGGFVSEPYIDKIEDDLHVYDFSSLYPHMYLGFCLFNKCKDLSDDYFEGTNIYPTILGNEQDGIKGKYLRRWGPIEATIDKLYTERMEVDKKLKDPEISKELKQKLKQEKLAIKICINTIYGISGSKKFVSIYDEETASDCTAMARRSIKYARTYLELSGYECVYTDTDSIYVKDPFKDPDKLDNITKQISENQRNAMNVYVKSHNFVHETAIKRIYFFKDDNDNYIKKHYVFVNDKDELTIKGINVKRGNCSKIAKKFFDERIAPKFIDNTYEHYHAEDLLRELKEFIIGKEELLLKRYRTNAPESYKVLEGKEEASGLYYQIAKKYGKGEHFLVINKRIGPGKGNKYAKLEELKEKYGDKWPDQIVYESYLNDLKEFIIVKERNSIHKTDRKRIKETSDET